jgi:hypothetical protein
MADEKAKNPKAQENGVQAEGPKACKAETCKAKPQKFGFCQDHYELYMAGVIRGDGKKPLDYDEKLSLFRKTNKSKVA